MDPHLAGAGPGAGAGSRERSKRKRNPPSPRDRGGAVASSGSGSGGAAASDRGNAERKRKSLRVEQRVAPRVHEGAPREHEGVTSVAPSSVGAGQGAGSGGDKSPARETAQPRNIKHAAKQSDPTVLVGCLKDAIDLGFVDGRNCRPVIKALRLALAELRKLALSRSAAKARAMKKFESGVMELLDELRWWVSPETPTTPEQAAAAAVERLCYLYACVHPEADVVSMKTALKPVTEAVAKALPKRDKCVEEGHCSVDNPVGWFLRLFSRLRGGYQTRWRCDDHDRSKEHRRFTSKQIKAFLDGDGHTCGVPIPHIVKVIPSAIIWCLEQLDAAGLEWPQFLEAVRELVAPEAWSGDITSFTTHFREWWRCNNPGPSASKHVQPKSCGVASV